MLTKIKVLCATSTSDLQKHFGMKPSSPAESIQIDINFKNIKHYMFDLTNINLFFQVWLTPYCSGRDWYVRENKSNETEEIEATAVFAKHSVGFILAHTFKQLTSMVKK